MRIVLSNRFRSVVLLATPPTRERSRGDASDIDGPVTQAKPRPGFPTERSNGAYGKSNIEGKTAREAASELGKERVSNERERMSQSFRSSGRRQVPPRVAPATETGSTLSSQLTTLNSSPKSYSFTTSICSRALFLRRPKGEQKFITERL